MIQRQLQRQTRNRKFTKGFTMVEVVVAGVLLIGAMSAVARLGATSYGISKTQGSRVSIESAVNNNIQLLQQADSYLTYKKIGSATKQDLACATPTSHLIDHLEAVVPEDELKNNIMSILNISTLDQDKDDIDEIFDREMKTVDGGDTRDVVQVTYRYVPIESDAPRGLREENEAGVEQEIRTVELNPNFSAHCYTTS